MNFVERLALLLCALWLALPLIPVGCSAAASGLEGAQRLNRSIRDLNEGARGDVTKAVPHTDDEGKGYLNDATNKLVQQAKDIEQQHGELSAVAKARLADLKAAKKAEEEKAKQDAKWYVVGGKFVEAAFWWIVGVLVLALATRVGSQFVGGSVGGILALVSTAMFGVLSGGISLVQSAFDNIYFRKTKPAREESNDA